MHRLSLRRRCGSAAVRIGEVLALAAHRGLRDGPATDVQAGLFEPIVLAHPKLGGVNVDGRPSDTLGQSLGVAAILLGVVDQVVFLLDPVLEAQADLIDLARCEIIGLVLPSLVLNSVEA